jgi:hypothetical protein
MLVTYNVFIHVQKLHIFFHIPTINTISSITYSEQELLEQDLREIGLRLENE